MQTEHAATLETLKDIRSIMERSARFVSLSGWSGIWAGVTALAGAAVARTIIGDYVMASGDLLPADIKDPVYLKLFVLAGITFITAGIGAFFFTMRKVRRQGQTIWGGASKKLALSVMIPLIAGGLFCLAFIMSGDDAYVAPACLAFYGLALVNGGKYTLGEIKYLGYSELLLGCICLYFPGYGLYFWAIGFGVMHILYGIIMWNRYDKQQA
jgi:hypothetical protein